MTVRANARVELDLGSGIFDDAIFDPGIFDLFSGWTDVFDQGDVRAAEPLIVQYGITSNRPADRIASTGKVTFALNNSEHNSGAALGYYALLNSAKRGGFDLNIPLRVVFMSDDVNSGQAYFKFRGVLDSAIPDAGAYGPRMTHCTAVDIWDDYARIDEPDITLPVNKRPDEVISSIRAALTTQPAAQTLETGSETYPVALDGATAANGRRLKVRERLNQLVLSEFGYLYSKGDTTQGGTFYFENRHHRVLNPTVQFTLTNSMDRDGLTAPGARADVFRIIQVTIHPTNDLTTASILVLWSLQTTTIVVNPGETNNTLFGPYYDPTTRSQIGGTNQIAPASGTDYAMNTASDGSGTDVTAAFTVSASYTGLGVAWTIANTGTVPAYVTKLQLRGKPIYRYDFQVERTVTGSYGDQVLQIDMPFQANANTAADVADYLAQKLSAPFAQISTVRFLANRSATHMAAALQLEPGDRIAVTETATGLSANQFTINGVQLELHPGGILFCTWWLESAWAHQSWVLGVAGASELGSTTSLGV